VSRGGVACGRAAGMVREQIRWSLSPSSNDEIGSRMTKQGISLKEGREDSRDRR
jgi:hypothetical protein